MAAGNLSRIAELIGQIAKGQFGEQFESFLNAVDSVGPKKAVAVFADIAGDQDCCTDKQGGGGDDGPCDTPTGTIWCDPDDWTDCATGKPFRLNTGGFPEPESCKQCEPDDSWELGRYWEIATGGEGTFRGATATTVAMQWVESVFNDPPLVIATYKSYSLGEPVVNGSDIDYPDARIQFTREFLNGDVVEDDRSRPMSHKACGASTESYCQLTEAPETCGPDWGQDGEVDFAVIGDCITASSCDPDATAQEQGCNECRDLCGPSGERMTVCATGDGGFVAYDQNGEQTGGKYDRYRNRQEQYEPGNNGGWV